MSKPIIGILSRVLGEYDKDINYIERCFVSMDYINAIESSGGTPIILPLVKGEENLRKFIEGIDGLLVPGGIDVNPLRYNEEPLEKIGSVSDDIDEFDIKAIRWANELKKPILGICRGLQVINVAFGGSLFQDLSLKSGSKFSHWQKAKKDTPTHSIEIKPGTRMFNLLGNNAVVNSYHHQAIKDLAEGFIASSFSMDGIIESIEKVNGGYVLAVQWHPEMMFNSHENMRKIFLDFIEECKKTKSGR